MFILQQTDRDIIDIDTLTVESILKSRSKNHLEYRKLHLNALKSAQAADTYRISENDIPIGDLRFVKVFLDRFLGVHNMNPIEVPKELQRYDVVKRNYSIVKGSELPRNGRYFVKDVSVLKNFSYQGDMLYLLSDSKYKVDNTLKINPDRLYQLSEIVDFVSEYRCFVRRGRVLGIQYYLGDPLTMPSESMINELKAWAMTYSLSNSAPKSYQMDVGIMVKNGKKQLALIEVHPVTSLGLYGFYTDSLPELYVEGFRWYIDENQRVKECIIKGQ